MYRCAVASSDVRLRRTISFPHLLLFLTTVERVSFCKDMQHNCRRSNWISMLGPYCHQLSYWRYLWTVKKVEKSVHNGSVQPYSKYSIPRIKRIFSGGSVRSDDVFNIFVPNILTKRNLTNFVSCSIVWWFLFHFLSVSTVRTRKQMDPCVYCRFCHGWKG